MQSLFSVSSEGKVTMSHHISRERHRNSQTAVVRSVFLFLFHFCTANYIYVVIL